MSELTKNILLFLLMSAAVYPAFSQTNHCVSNLDSNDVIQIARKKKVYWTESWQCTPQLKLDELSCEWTVTSCKISHTNRGDCKHTNGCTVTTIATLVIHATTHKVVRLEKIKHITPNYE
jgi:hypothetical protein